MLADKDLAVVTAVAAGLGAPILLLVSDRLLGGALGMGDVKLAVSLGLMAGISRFVGGFLVASVLSAVVLITLIALRRLSLRSAIPFGPSHRGGHHGDAAAGRLTRAGLRHPARAAYHPRNAGARAVPLPLSR